MDQVGIYNLALGRIGSNLAVGIPTERTVEAQTCNRVYDHCRRVVLRGHAWQFATRPVALVQVSGEDIPGWPYLYQYPDNCLRVLVLTDIAGVRFGSRYWRWGDWRMWPDLQAYQNQYRVFLREDGASRVIGADIPDAYVFGVFDVPNTGAMPDDFADVLGWRLAMEVGGPLKAKRELVDAAEARFRAWASMAAATDKNEQRGEGPADSPSITCRA